MEDDFASSEQVDAAAAAAEASFETLQHLALQLTAAAAASTAPSKRKWEDCDYERVLPESFLYSFAAEPRTLDEMSPCTSASPAVVGEEVVGEVEGTDMEVIEKILASLETPRAPETASASSATTPQEASAPALRPTPKWGSATMPQAAAASALFPTPKCGSPTMPHAAAASTLQPTPRDSASSGRLAEAWRSRPDHPSGAATAMEAGGTKSGTRRSTSGKSRPWRVGEHTFRVLLDAILR